MTVFEGGGSQLWSGRSRADAGRAAFGRGRTMLGRARGGGRTMRDRARGGGRTMRDRARGGGRTMRDVGRSVCVRRCGPSVTGRAGGEHARAFGRAFWRLWSSVRSLPKSSERSTAPQSSNYRSSEGEQFPARTTAVDSLQPGCQSDGTKGRGAGCCLRTLPALRLVFVLGSRWARLDRSRTFHGEPCRLS